MRQSISAGNGKRGGMGVRQPPAEGVAEAAAVVPAEDPEPMKTTKTSSMAVASGNSCLLWSTLVMAAAVGLPMAASPPDAATMAVRSCTDRPRPGRSCLEAVPSAACPCLEAASQAVPLAVGGSSAGRASLARGREQAAPLAGGGSSAGHAPDWRRLLLWLRPWMESPQLAAPPASHPASI